LRLGREKALERLNKQTLIERTIDCLSPICQTILVVTSQEQFSLIAAAGLKVRVIVDFYPGRGALGGIYTGLATANSFYSLVVGCDMPFLNRDFLSYLIDLAPDYDAVVPRVDDMLEPLHAVYSRDCLSPIKELLNQDRLGISQVFNLVKTKYVSKDEITKFDPDYSSFFNVNTQDDLRKARELMKQRGECLTVREGGF
jgi:molybdopterin-guanine dinucleotide biosynthesis protein A